MLSALPVSYSKEKSRPRLRLKGKFNIFVLLLVGMVPLLAAACGDSVSEMRGLITEVQAASLTEVESFTLQEEGTGKLWTFTAEGFIGFTPSHLRQHMLEGQMVVVRYRDSYGRLVAILVSDV